MPRSREEPPRPPPRAARDGALAGRVALVTGAARGQGRAIVLTRVAALDLAPEGIRVNAIVPGPVLTPMVLRDDDPDAAARLARTPLGRAGLPADVAELALFLASDASSFVTGAEVVIDGGQTAGVVQARGGHSSITRRAKRQRPSSPRSSSSR